MKNDPWDKYYNKAKELRINAIYADTLCELILLRYEYVYDNISKDDTTKATKEKLQPKRSTSVRSPCAAASGCKRKENNNETQLLRHLGQRSKMLRMGR